MNFIKKANKSWEKSSMHILLHWFVFLVVVYTAMDMLVSTITMTSLETQGMEAHATTLRELQDLSN